MRTQADPTLATFTPESRAARPSPNEPVDLDDLAAVQRAIALHQAGEAVFAIPFNSHERATLTWLDPSRR